VGKINGHSLWLFWLIFEKIWCVELYQSITIPLFFNGLVKELEKEEDNLIKTRRNWNECATHAEIQNLKTKVIDKWLENANIDLEDMNRLPRE